MLMLKAHLRVVFVWVTDGGCDLVIVGGDCDGGREEVVKLQNMLVH